MSSFGCNAFYIVWLWFTASKDLFDNLAEIKMSSLIMPKTLLSVSSMSIKLTNANSVQFLSSKESERSIGFIVDWIELFSFTFLDSNIARKFILVMWVWAFYRFFFFIWIGDYAKQSIKMDCWAMRYEN